MSFGQSSIEVSLFENRFPVIKRNLIVLDRLHVV